jgi:hypothetical protein
MITMSRMKNKNLDELEEAIDRLFEALKDQEPGTEDYAKMAALLDQLYKLKEIDSKSRLSRDVIATIGANLAGVILILSYEHGRVVTSKALTFVPKLFR